MSNVKEDIIRLFNILLDSKYKCIVFVNENKVVSVSNNSLASKDSWRPSRAYEGYTKINESLTDEEKRNLQKLDNPVTIACYIITTKTLTVSTHSGDNLKEDTYSCQLYSLNNLLDIIDTLEYNLASKKFFKSNLANYIISLDKSISYDQNGQQILRFQIVHRHIKDKIKQEYPIDSYTFNIKGA